MFDFPLMLQVKLPVAERSQLQSNKFVIPVENKGTGDSELNDSPVDGRVAKKEKSTLLFSFNTGTFLVCLIYKNVN